MRRRPFRPRLETYERWFSELYEVTSNPCRNCRINGEYCEESEGCSAWEIIDGIRNAIRRIEENED